MSNNSLFNQYIAVDFPIDRNETETVICLVESHAFHKAEKDMTYTYKGRKIQAKKGDTYYAGELVLRIDPRELSKKCEAYLIENYPCLNPYGSTSRLYIISKERLRQYVKGEVIEQAGQSVVPVRQKPAKAIHRN